MIRAALEKVKGAGQASEEERLSERAVEHLEPTPADFEVRFDPCLSAEAVAETVGALGNYFRACGGAGLEFRFSKDQAEMPVRELA